MSSVSEPMRPAYVAGESTVVMDAGAGVAAFDAGRKTKMSSRSRTKKCQSRKKASKSSAKGARNFVKAAYEPLRRAMKGESSAHKVAKAERRARTGAIVGETHDAAGRQTASGRSPEVSAVCELIAGDTNAKAASCAAPKASAAVAPVEVIDAPQATRTAPMGDIASAVAAAAATASSGLMVAAQSDVERIRVTETRVRESLQKFEAAMRQMEVRFEVLDRDISLKKNRKPIHHIESRVKKPASIVEKLQRQGFPVSVKSMEENLFDIAGVRVICSYIFDVYALLDLMKKQDDLEVVAIKDYIANPKPNGYRSLHVIVRIPVYFMDKKEMVPVEVQLRTIAMDFWASLEHSLKYKAVHEVQGIDASDELKDCSRIIEDVEARMQILARALEGDG